MRNWYLGNYKKKEGEKSLCILTGDAKNEMLGPSGPPYALLDTLDTFTLDKFTLDTFTLDKFRYFA